MKFNAELKRIELYLKNNEFNAYKRINSCENKKEDRINNNEYKVYEWINSCKNDIEKQINENDKNLKNSDIKDKIRDILKLYDTLLDRHIKNKLFFFTSTPFYDANGYPLKTESNHSFYLKYKLSLALPNLQFEFKKIDENLDNIKKCLEYPIKFLYIGSDDFNEQGDICYVDNNYKSNFKKFQNFIDIMNGLKCETLCDILILGIINGINDKLDELLKKFRYIIYFGKIDSTLCENLKNYPYYYIYFKKKFYNFIKEFLLNLCKARGCLTIKEAFRRANNNFENAMKFVEIEHGETKCEKNTNLSGLNLLLGTREEKYDDYIYDFGTFNDEDNNQTLDKSKKDIYDEYDDEDIKKNNIYFRKNPFVDEQENEDVISYKKSRKFWKFPGKGDLSNKKFNNLVESAFFSMEDLFRDIINNVKEYKYCNVFGKKFTGKTRICLEVCKHFFMNEEKFKKGIFVFDLRFFNSVKDKIPELNNIMNSKKKNIKKSQKAKEDGNNEIENDILLLIENANTSKEGFIEWLEALNVHALIISDESLDKIYPILPQNKKNEKPKINDINITYYNKEEKASKFKQKYKEYENDYKAYKFFK